MKLFSKPCTWQKRHSSILSKQQRRVGKDFSVVRSQEYIFEAMPKGYTKATALKALSENLACLAKLWR